MEWAICRGEFIDDPGTARFHPIDSYALKMVSHEWYEGRPVTAKHVEKRFEKWGEFKELRSGSGIGHIMEAKCMSITSSRWQVKRYLLNVWRTTD
jgi:hypothetical protein